MTIQDIPLNKLSISPLNVRTTGPDDPGLAQLAANIAANGLQQNLVVIPKNKRAGTYQVIAGGRRLAALQALAEDEHIDTDASISCRVEHDKAKAPELSLAENELRLNMSPADACTAFAALIEKGRSIEDIATSFGVTMRFIKQRIALAKLAPPVFEALKDGSITLDVAQAFANCPDAQRQVSVFESNQWNLTNKDHIARQLRATATPSSHRLAVFVGADDYRAAGGVVTQQLFDEDDLFEDTDTLQDVAMKKLERAVVDAATKMGVAEVRTLPDTYMPYHVDGLSRLYPDERDPTADEQHQIDLLESELEDLHGQANCDDLDEDAYNDLDLQIHQLEDDLKTLRQGLHVFDPEMKSQAIAFAIIDDHGKAVIDDKLYVPNALLKSSKASASGDGAGEQSTNPMESAKLLDELAEHRAMILAAGLAQAPELAQDLGRFELTVSIITSISAPNAFALHAGRLDRRVNAMHLADTIAAKSLRTSLEPLNAAWLQEPTYNVMFARFCELPETDKIAWFAFAVAHSVQPVLNDPSNAYFKHEARFQDHIFAPLGMAEQDWWRPTVQNYFGRVNKARCLAIAEEIGGDALKAQLAGLKKGEIAQTLEDICAGRGHLSDETRQKALAWVPDVMRFSEPGDVEKSSFGQTINVRGLETPEAISSDTPALADMPETDVADDWEDAIADPDDEDDLADAA